MHLINKNTVGDGKHSAYPENLPSAEAPAPTKAPTPVSSISAVTRARLHTVSVDVPLAKVAAVLSRAQTSVVIVCDVPGVMVGVITETILVQQLSFGLADIFTMPASEVMARECTVCTPTESLSEVLATMHTRGLVHVPVVDAEKRPQASFTHATACGRCWWLANTKKRCCATM